MDSASRLHTLYTIGHGNHPIDRFISLLKEKGIEYLVDVRSIPWSGRWPQFRKKELQKALEASGIRYVYMGQELGGIPKDPTVKKEGKIDYDSLREKEYFQEGIRRLKKAWEQKQMLAFMCAESNPAHCHRSRLVGVALEKEGVQIQHILPDGKLKPQENVMQEARKGKGHRDLFNQEKE